MGDKEWHNGCRTPTQDPSTVLTIDGFLSAQVAAGDRSPRLNSKLLHAARPLVRTKPLQLYLLKQLEGLVGLQAATGICTDPGPSSPRNCVPVCAAPTLNAAGQPRVTLSPR